MQKQRSPGSIYTGIIKNTYRSTFESYIKELLVQKYWQLISTKQLWSVPNIVSSKSRTVQYRVPRCPGQYRNVQVPSCPGTEMSRIPVGSAEARIWSTTPKCIDKRSKNWLDWKVHITPKTQAYDLCSLLFNIIVFVECPSCPDWK